MGLLEDKSPCNVGLIFLLGLPLNNTDPRNRNL